MQKESHEIFVITGKNNINDKKIKGIFQQYNFDFTSERVGNVIENVKTKINNKSDSINNDIFNTFRL